MKQKNRRMLMRSVSLVVSLMMMFNINLLQTFAATDISTAVITVIDESKIFYTGKQQKPRVEVKVDGGELRQNVDYTVHYGENIEAGKAEVTVTGKEPSYTGSKTVEFAIAPAQVNVSPKPLTLSQGAALLESSQYMEDKNNWMIISVFSFSEEDENKIKDVCTVKYIYEGEDGYKTIEDTSNCDLNNPEVSIEVSNREVLGSNFLVQGNSAPLTIKPITSDNLKVNGDDPFKFENGVESKIVNMTRWFNISPVKIMSSNEKFPYMRLSEEDKWSNELTLTDKGDGKNLLSKLQFSMTGDDSSTPVEYTPEYAYQIDTTNPEFEVKVTTADGEDYTYDADKPTDKDIVFTLTPKEGLADKNFSGTRYYYQYSNNGYWNEVFAAADGSYTFKVTGKSNATYKFMAETGAGKQYTIEEGFKVNKIEPNLGPSVVIGEKEYYSSYSPINDENTQNELKKEVEKQIDNLDKNNKYTIEYRDIYFLKKDENGNISRAEDDEVKGITEVPTPYPDGTDIVGNEFIVVHMLKDGSFETVETERTEDVLKLHVNGLSPFAIAWKGVSVYKITVELGEGGTIEPLSESPIKVEDNIEDNIIKANAGSNVTVNILPNSGYEVSNLVIGDKNLGSMSSYTFNDMSDNHTMKVEFKQAEQIIPGEPGSPGESGSQDGQTPEGEDKGKGDADENNNNGGEDKNNNNGGADKNNNNGDVDKNNNNSGTKDGNGFSTGEDTVALSIILASIAISGAIIVLMNLKNINKKKSNVVNFRNSER